MSKNIFGVGDMKNRKAIQRILTAALACKDCHMNDLTAE